MKNLLEYILIRLVEHPEEVQIAETDDNGTTILTITANDADYGRIIGRGGAVISAIRQIIRVRAIKEGKKVVVKVAATPIEESSADAAQTPASPATPAADTDTETDEPAE
jgi:predicted RNA-binding protein YlqC (UPF0109 family)